MMSASEESPNIRVIPDIFRNRVVVEIRDLISNKTIVLRVTSDAVADLIDQLSQAKIMINSGHLYNGTIADDKVKN